MKGGAES